MMNNIKEKINKYLYLKQPLFIFIIIYLVSLISLIRANFNYTDDLGRTALGYQGWGNFSRYFSNIISTFLHTDRYLMDISPLPQLLAALLLCVSSVLIIKIFSKEQKVSLWQIIALIPFGLSPHFMECFSYKYDAPYMSLSILFMVIPFLFIQNKKIFSIVTIISTVCMCLTYQVSSCVYLMIFTLLMFNWWLEKRELKEIGKYTLIASISYVIGLLFFKTFIMHSESTYVSTKMYSLSELIPGILYNIKDYYYNILNSFRPLWLILIGIIIVLFIIYTTINSKRNKIQTFILSIITICLLLIFSIGIYITLEKVLFASSRYLYGFGILISLISLFLCKEDKNYIPKFICLALSWCFVIYALIYGNALSEQKRYTEFRANLLLSDLNNISYMKNNPIYVKLEGDIGRSPIVNNMIKKNKLLNVVPYTLGENYYWGEFYFQNYFGLNNIIYTKDDLSKMNLPIIKDGIYHTIRGNNEYILIQLK